MLSTYLPNSREPKRVRPLRYFFFKSLLYARIDVGLDKISDSSEELVNVYLVNLLVRLLGIDDMWRFSHPTAAEVYQTVNAFHCPRQRADVWRFNGEARLIAQSIFTQGRSREWFFGPQWIGMNSDISGSFCYQAAAGLYQRDQIRKVALPEIFLRVSESFTSYRDLLRHLAGEYLNILSVVTAVELEEMVDQEKRIRLFDLWLDIWHKWKRTRDPDLAEQLLRLTSNLEIPKEKIPSDFPQ